MSTRWKLVLIQVPVYFRHSGLSKLASWKFKIIRKGSGVFFGSGGRRWLIFGRYYNKLVEGLGGFRGSVKSK